MNGGQLFRRLVFAQNKNVVQSEARLTEGDCCRENKISN